MKMPSSCQCIWCGDSSKPLAEGKKGADRCKSCSTRHEKRKMYTKNEAIALAKTAKGKNKMMNDEQGEESGEFSPLS